jgi:DNA-directed RNA polymerase specialized sigma24 family protein
MSLWPMKAWPTPAAWRRDGASGATSLGRTPCVDDLLEAYFAADDARSREIECTLLALAQPRIRRFLRGRRVRDDDLEDLCQASAIRLLQALRNRRADGRRIERWDKYVITLAFNVFLDYWRWMDVRKGTGSTEDLIRRGDANPDAALPAGGEDLAAAVTNALFIQKRWQELWLVICTLPQDQCGALLLHLEPDELLRLAGTKSAVAEALDIPIGELREVWPALPLSDRKIAVRLGVIEQDNKNEQDIKKAEKRASNLRGCALKRLRRLKPLDPR